MSAKDISRPLNKSTKLIKFFLAHRCEKSTTKAGKHPSQGKPTPVNTGIHIANTPISNNIIAMKNHNNQTIEQNTPRRSLGSMLVDSMKS